MFIVALFTIARKWIQHTCPEVEKWIKKIKYTYTIEFYAVTESKIITFAGKCLYKYVSAQLRTHIV